MSRRRVKDFLPRSLYGRAALIFLVPVLTILGVTSVVFIQRLYEDVTRQMTMGVAHEINLVRERLSASDTPEKALMSAWDVARPLSMTIRVDDVPAGTARSLLDISGATIVETLLETVPDLRGVDLVSRDGEVIIGLDTVHGPVAVEMSRRRFSARNPHQFLVLMGITALVMTLIALLYLRGQIRPIRRLAAAASAFGKGRVVPYRPGGAAEVREAGRAFIEMRDRIERQIEQRTLMLSGISHDIRTPLTRMRLALSLSADEETAGEMRRDIEDMERMLDAFLDFARNDTLDDPDEVSPRAFVEAALERARRAGANVERGGLESTGVVRLRPVAMARALDNLIGNAVRHGTRARVGLQDDDDKVRFMVEDDGPGIAPEDREEALKPFSRLDRARNQDGGSGVGLGLAIAADIARQHGGKLLLDTSETLGGLKAEIVVPK